MEFPNFKFDLNHNSAIRKHFDTMTLSQISPQKLSCLTGYKSLNSEIKSKIDAFKQKIPSNIDWNIKIKDILSIDDYYEFIHEKTLIEKDIYSFDIYQQEVHQLILQKHQWEEQKYIEIFGADILHQLQSIVNSYERSTHQLISLEVKYRNLKWLVWPLCKRGPINVDLGDIRTQFDNLEDLWKKDLLLSYIRLDTPKIDGCSLEAHQIHVYKFNRGWRLGSHQKFYGYVGFVDPFYNDISICKEIPEEMMKELKEVNSNFEYKLERIDLRDIRVGGLIYNRSRNLEYLTNLDDLRLYYIRSSFSLKLQPNSEDQCELKKINKRVSFLTSKYVRNKARKFIVGAVYIISMMKRMPSYFLSKYRDFCPVFDILPVLIKTQDPICPTREDIYEKFDVSYEEVTISVSIADIMSIFHWLFLIFNMELGKSFRDDDHRLILPDIKYSPPKIIKSSKEVFLNNTLEKANYLFGTYFSLYDEERSVFLEQNSEGNLYLYPSDLSYRDLTYLVRILAIIPPEYLNKYSSLFPLDFMIYDSSFEVTWERFIEMLLDNIPLVVNPNKCLTPQKIHDTYNITVKSPEEWILLILKDQDWFTSKINNIRTNLYTFIGYIFQKELKTQYNHILTCEPLGDDAESIQKMYYKL